MFRAARGCSTLCAFVVALLAVPADSKAGWLTDCLFGGCCGGGARTTYMAPYAAPTYAAPACGTCAPQTCHYVPQTCYRTVYQAVPVTTCQAFTACDPCTGCPVSAYRPVTAWTHQARLVPYTTYRLVYSNPCTPGASYSPCASCGPTACGPTACGPTTYAVPASPCASCPGGATIVRPAPYTSPPAGSVVPYTTPPTGSPLVPSPSSPADVPPATNNPTVPRTYAPESKPTTESHLLPIPKTETQWNSTPAPKLIDPENRTTLRPVRQASLFQLIASPPRPAPAQNPALGNGGWRASQD